MVVWHLDFIINRPSKVSGNKLIVRESVKKKMLSRLFLLIDWKESDINTSSLAIELQY
jgi:hypothetical protein